MDRDDLDRARHDDRDHKRPARTVDLDCGDATIHARISGDGDPVLLLHGFPETHRMWRDVAPELERHGFTTVCADLRGYGASSCPPSAPDHRPYSKRVLAADMVELMAQLGFARFGVAGHDRGGRVAYRAALDHADRITALAVLDVLPVDFVWEHADDRFALGFWPWSLLAQPAPLPERLLAAAPEAILDHALSPEWGSPAATFDAETRAIYADALRDPEHVHAICEEYRAGATIDRADDAADRGAGRRITCPVLALWSASGPLSTWYDHLGGPLTVWRELADRVDGHAVEGGHFFPEEYPARIGASLAEFFAGAT
jgi:haloacetate dehalogenase